jgi:uncharacterized membrane protein
MLKKNKSILIILIISVIFCLDLFIKGGRPSTFDGPTHLTNIAQFADALQRGDFPVRWMDGFANYGMPMPIIVQQTTAYLGALVTLIFHNVVFAYNVVVFIGAFLSLYFLFTFLRIHFSENASLLAVILFNFAPYRIINVYVRGALPEFFAHVFFPLVFMGLYYWIEKRSGKGLLYLLVGLVGILLTHPFTLVIGSFLFVPYGIWLLFEKKQNPFELRFLMPIIITTLLSFGLAAYYILPLLSEIKYFYYGQSGAGLKPDQFLTPLNYIGDYWFYFTKNDIDVRGHIIHLGLMELGIILGGFVLLFMQKKKRYSIIWVFVSLIALVFFTSRYANPLYEKISFLGGIQYNWRMFASIVYISPFIAAFIYDVLKKDVIIYIVVLLIIVTRIPQLYGKNFLIEPQSKYYFTLENMHGVVLNTIWTGKTEDYPVKQVKGEIIEGKGTIVAREESNSWRKYEVDAQTELRMIDNTFYFPGWKVFIDGRSTEIQFQDMNYRGVITYAVPQGKHSILVMFTNTKIRILANVISIFSLGILLLTILLRKKLFRHSS